MQINTKNKKINTKIILLKQVFANTLVFFVLFIFIVPIFVYAGAATPEATTIENPIAGASDLMGLLTIILNNIIMPMAAVACVVWIIYAGFLYVTAQGNPAAITKAHNTLLWALVGTGILLGAAGISSVLKNTIDAVVKT